MVCFHLSASEARYKTQNHLGYSELNEITPATAQKDVGVISIKISRSVMELLTDFGDFECPNELGRGLGNPLPPPRAIRRGHDHPAAQSCQRNPVRVVVGKSKLPAENPKPGRNRSVPNNSCDGRKDLRKVKLTPLPCPSKWKKMTRIGC